MLQNIPTAIWLDRIDAIKGGAANGGRLSLAQHLDEALAQAAAAGKPALVTIVVYDLPNRCHQRCSTAGQGSAASVWSFASPHQAAAPACESCLATAGAIAAGPQRCSRCIASVCMRSMLQEC